jgi:hypothetical protein
VWHALEGYGYAGAVAGEYTDKRLSSDSIGRSSYPSSPPPSAPQRESYSPARGTLPSPPPSPSKSPLASVASVEERMRALKTSSRPSETRSNGIPVRATPSKAYYDFGSKGGPTAQDSTYYSNAPFKAGAASGVERSATPPHSRDADEEDDEDADWKQYVPRVTGRGVDLPATSRRSPTPTSPLKNEIRRFVPPFEAEDNVDRSQRSGSPVGRRPLPPPPTLSRSPSPKRFSSSPTRQLGSGHHTSPPFEEDETRDDFLPSLRHDLAPSSSPFRSRQPPPETVERSYPSDTRSSTSTVPSLSYSISSAGSSATSNLRLGGASKRSSSPSPTLAGQDRCSRCGEVVYFAERALAVGLK